MTNTGWAMASYASAQSTQLAISLVACSGGCCQTAARSFAVVWVVGLHHVQLDVSEGQAAR